RLSTVFPASAFWTAGGLRVSLKGSQVGLLERGAATRRLSATGPLILAPFTRRWSTLSFPCFMAIETTSSISCGTQLHSTDHSSIPRECCSSTFCEPTTDKDVLRRRRSKCRSPGSLTQLSRLWTTTPRFGRD